MMCTLHQTKLECHMSRPFNKIGGEYGTHGREEKFIQDFGGEVWTTGAAWKTWTQMDR
jgi:hypothetical protein